MDESFRNYRSLEDQWASNFARVPKEKLPRIADLVTNKIKEKREGIQSTGQPLTGLETLWGTLFDKLSVEDLMRILNVLESKSNESRLETTVSHEKAPALRAIKVSENSLAAALKKYPNGAGETEFDWILANQEEAKKILPQDGGHFFFPGMQSVLRKLVFSGGKFTEHMSMRPLEWNSRDYVVLVDK